jgi:soluble lytic murein transglycosylase
MGLGAAVFLIVSQLAAQVGMRGYIQNQADARESARYRLIAEHPLAYRGLIEFYAEVNNLMPSFVAAVIMAESSYRKDALSYADARGLMQIKPDTGLWIARRLGEDAAFTPERLYDPETSIRYGTWYLGYLSELFLGRPALVAAAYHAGQNTVMNWIQAGAEGLEDLPDGSTKDYAGKVLTAYGVYERLYFAADAEMGADPMQY